MEKIELVGGPRCGASTLLLDNTDTYTYINTVTVGSTVMFEPCVYRPSVNSQRNGRLVFMFVGHGRD